MKKRKEKEEKILEKDIEEFLKEKETIRNIIGRIGGKATFANKAMNFFWLVAVIVTFIISIFMQNTPRLIMIEVGIFLISLKVVYYFHCQARVNHFQFWILSSIEWRINEIVKKLNDLTEESEEKE
ncbi:MAG: hypothetical protein GXO98_07195 [Nitrospirae bacterium]|nr:hypothetical protein [Nitrospirota bacterium]